MCKSHETEGQPGIVGCRLWPNWIFRPDRQSFAWLQSEEPRTQTLEGNDWESTKTDRALACSQGEQNICRAVSTELYRINRVRHRFLGNGAEN